MMLYTKLFSLMGGHVITICVNYSIANELIFIVMIVEALIDVSLMFVFFVWKDEATYSFWKNLKGKWFLL